MLGTIIAVVRLSFTIEAMIDLHDGERQECITLYILDITNMGSNTNSKEGTRGMVDFLFSVVPWVAVLFILLSKQRPAIKATALIATLVGLIASALYSGNY